MRLVDVDDRRQLIAASAIDVIAREGLTAATIRRIAKEIGYSTAVITPYFADKQELLLWAFRILAEEGERLFDEVIAQDPTDLVGCLLTMTASSESTMRRWRAYLAYWDHAARDPVFAAEYRLKTKLGLSSIARVVRARNGDQVDATRASRLLSAIVHGISMQALVDQQGWSQDQVRCMLTEEVELVLGAPAPHKANQIKIRSED